MSEDGGASDELTKKRALVAVLVANALAARAAQREEASQSEEQSPEVDLIPGPSRWVNLGRARVLQPRQPRQRLGR